MIRSLFALIVTCLAAKMFSQKVDSLSIYSESMNKEIKTLVVHPSKNRNKNLPTVYILHVTADIPKEH